MQIKFNGENIEIDDGSSLRDLAKRKKIKKAVAGIVNGSPVDLSYQLDNGDEAEFLTFEDDIGREIFLHSAAHILAQALTELYPGVKLTIGPAIANGFYYDVESPTVISEKDLPAIEMRMKKIVKRNIPITSNIISRAEALKLYADNEYKRELIDAVEDDEMGVYYQGDFFDLCSGPHIPSTGAIKALKLTSVAGAYWRGDEKNVMLTRVYGAAYPDNERLQAYLDGIEKAKKRDHRKLGRELELFSFGEERGAGLPYYHPNGAIVRDEIETYWKQVHREWGYDLVSTPHIANAKLFATSGHLDFYREHIYVFDIDGQEYVLKPMNCPMHVAIYQTSLHSYRELPIRYAELGTVYRYEPSGTLHGLLRVRGFTVDDGHIFCTEEQMEGELIKCVELAVMLLNSYGFEDIAVDISVRDPENKDKYIGTDHEWDMAESALKSVLEQLDMAYTVEEGEAVFYGPKIDMQIVDSLGRKWQGPTIQFDFNLPRRFGVEYAGSDGAMHTPYIIHRAMHGSLERFMGNLIEHYAGVFPLWLAPSQLTILPVTTVHEEYANSIMEQAKRSGLRVNVNEANEKLGARIRKSEMSKTPYLAIVGDDEVENKSVSLRRHGGKDIGKLTIDEMLMMLKNEIESKDTGLESATT